MPCRATARHPARPCRRNLTIVKDHAAPFVTYYDDATGERIELSSTTFANWVAKTANLLRDDFDVEPGANIGLQLPPHWLTPVWIAAIAEVGSTVVAGLELSAADSPQLDVVVVGPNHLLDPPAGQDVIACSLRPLGLPFIEPLPADFVDYAAEVRGHGDQFGPSESIPWDRPALVVGDRFWTSVGLAAAAADLARAWGLTRGGRLLVTSAPNEVNPAELWLSLYSVPTAVDGSIVIVRNADQAKLDHIAEQEGVTAVRPI